MTPFDSFDARSFRIVDLSHELVKGCPHWPGDTPFDLRNDLAGVGDDGVFVYANTITMGEHVGTHMDSPRHMTAKGPPIDDVPLYRCIGPGVRIDVSDLTGDDRNYEMPLSALIKWEAEHGRIPDHAIVLIRTGHAARWAEGVGAYIGGDSGLQFPGIHPDAARWLVGERHIRAIGIDTPAIDCGKSTSFVTHRILLEQEVPIIENLANLDQLPATGFLVIALPLKIRSGSGSPLRAVALL